MVRCIIKWKAMTDQIWKQNCLKFEVV
jgi:hypothetical protein